MGKYIGHINCGTCGYQHLTSPDQVTIWFALDAKEQICQIICPSCKQLKSSRIGIEDFIAFRTHGVKLTPLTGLYPKLTQEELDGWDCQKEFRDGFSNFI